MSAMHPSVRYTCCQPGTASLGMAEVLGGGVDAGAVGGGAVGAVGGSMCGSVCGSV